MLLDRALKGAAGNFAGLSVDPAVSGREALAIIAARG
jgi:hypothetical protein